MIGNGGHSKVIQEMISCNQDDKVIAILDDKYEMIVTDEGIMYGSLSYVKEIKKQHVKFLIAIGANQTRKLLFERIDLDLDQYATSIHPTAVISPTATIGHGTVVMPHAIINANAMVGEHCIINSGAIIEHESQVGHFSHVSPNATLTGGVTVGEGVHIGASATVIPGLRIGDWSIIGASSTVIDHIPAYSKVVGSPTRFIDHNKREGKSEDKVVILHDKS